MTKKSARIAANLYIQSLQEKDGLLHTMPQGAHGMATGIQIMEKEENAK